MGNVKETNIKNRTYYLFDDIINIKNFDPNLLEIDKKSNNNCIKVFEIVFKNHIRVQNY